METLANGPLDPQSPFSRLLGLSNFHAELSVSLRPLESFLVHLAFRLCEHQCARLSSAPIKTRFAAFAVWAADCSLRPYVVFCLLPTLSLGYDCTGENN